MSTILIHNGSVLTMNQDSRVHIPGWVWIVNDRIDRVEPGVPPAQFHTQADRVIDASYMAVLPGLVNAHTHLSQTFMRGLGDDKPLLEWLKNVMWPIQAAFSAEDMHMAALLGLVENVRCGVTAVNQHQKLPFPAMSDAALAAAQRIGLRFQLARTWVDLGTAAEKADEILVEMRRLFDTWQGSASGRLTIGFGPMAPWRCSEHSMRSFVAQARSWGVPTHIHVAEAEDEIEILLQRSGLRHIEWLADLEVLGPDLQLVHCVHVTEEEQNLIGNSGAVVVHCPTSNMYLASGIAPIPSLLQQGIPVALGTDGSASHNSQDLLETLKTAVLLAKVGSGDPTALLPMDALRMVTTTGAKIMGRDDIGQLTPGFKADITLVNLNKVHTMPVHRPESAVVYNSNGPDVDTVMVNGEILLDRGRLTMLDEEALLEACRQAANHLLIRAGIREEADGTKR
ncbi:MAG: amidohydrolase [Candidatus Promineifilaceae bacterium]|nr:amidohydrolase [Candidatus Promineifilaceae bacterium]